MTVYDSWRDELVDPNVSSGNSIKIKTNFYSLTNDVFLIQHVIIYQIHLKQKKETLTKSSYFENDNFQVDAVSTMLDYFGFQSLCILPFCKFVFKYYPNDEMIKKL